MAKGDPLLEKVSRATDIEAIPIFLVPYQFNFTTTVDAGTHATVHDIGIETGVDASAGDVSAIANSSDTYLEKTLTFKAKSSRDPSEVATDLYYWGVGFGTLDWYISAQVSFCVSADRSRCRTADGVADSSIIPPETILNTIEDDYKVVWTSTEAKFYKGGVLLGTITTTLPTVALALEIKSQNTDTATAVTHWLRVRTIEVI